MEKTKQNPVVDASTNFLDRTAMMKYGKENATTIRFEHIDEIDLETEKPEINWLNTYGINFKAEGKKIVSINKLDSFLNTLMSENEHRNKVIELHNSIFLSIRTLHYEKQGFHSEQLLFAASSQFVWSIQERKGDYFGKLRKRIANPKDIIRTKNAAYLLFAIIEAIIENYEDVYEKLSEDNLKGLKLIDVNPTPLFAEKIEQKKQQLFVLKKGISSLRDAIAKIEKTTLENYEPRYFTELKEQANYLIDDIDFDLQQLESTINLIFNLQSHKLNEVMKTLTVFSVIFIPLTFIAGIYGMNFKHIPELELENGYFYLWALMLFITLASVVYFKKKKWF